MFQILVDVDLALRNRECPVGRRRINVAGDVGIRVGDRTAGAGEVEPEVTFEVEFEATLQVDIGNADVVQRRGAAVGTDGVQVAQGLCGRTGAADAGLIVFIQQRLRSCDRIVFVQSSLVAADVGGDVEFFVVCGEYARRDAL